MAQTINTNVNSLTAQRNLSMSQTSLSTSMQRLSSGLRVNSAKDDAAGLAIAERMNTQIRGLNVAARNANDGISFAQIGEGALGKIGDMLQRMRELAVQSSNATNSVSDRKALQSEVSQLSNEIDRVAKTTAFNGTKLLDGSSGSFIFQVGANSGEAISFDNIVNAKPSALGTTKISSEQVAIVTGSGGGVGDTQIMDPLTDGVPIPAGTMTILDTSSPPVAIPLGAIASATTNGQRNQQVVDAINAKASDTGVNARVSYDAAGVATGYEIFSDRDTLDATGQPILAGFGAGTGAAAPVGATVVANATPPTMADVSVSSFGDAQLSLKIIDNSINAINSSRADLGALQSRFENAIANISITSENTSAARGRIVDADFAAETANMSRANILQQAGTAMVAQANQLPQQVLQLLKS